jgi:acyl-CoA synthetase (AMP-forming)/AMP-acid ligase II
MINLCQILWDRAKSVPHETYVYNSVTEGVSYSKAAARATKLADYLRCNGRFSQKPVLAVILDNAEFIVYIIWACLAAGICLAFLPKNRHLGQTRVLMSQVGADALVTNVPELQALSLHLPFDVLETTHSVWREFDLVAPHTPAFIFQTSGTTGEAKWVKVSHGHFFAAIDRRLVACGWFESCD